MSFLPGNPHDQGHESDQAHAQVRTMSLGQLKPGQSARILRIAGSAEPESKEIAQRLMEMGFLAGSLVEVIHEAPFGHDPLAVRVRGTLIALRRSEANRVEV